MISQDAKIELLAMRLSGYDADTWARLKPNRKRTYVRAGSILLLYWPDFERLMRGWSGAGDLEGTNQ